MLTVALRLDVEPEKNTAGLAQKAKHVTSIELSEELLAIQANQVNPKWNMFVIPVAVMLLG